MASNNTLTAEILETSASGFAAAANSLLRRRLAAAAPGGVEGGSWKRHFEQRILELAAAVRLDDPAVFQSRIDWLRRACQARGADEATLRASIESLRDALTAELPEAAGAAVAATVERAARSFDAPLGPGAGNIDGATPAGHLALRYLQACLEGRTVSATRLITDAAAGGMPLETLLLDVLVPAQRQTGQLWHMGDITIAEERLVSETTKQLLSILAERHGPAAGNGRVMLGASVAGNAHDMALRVITALFRLDGWECLFLGADMPPADIAGAVATFGVDLVLLNATLSTQLKGLEETIGQIRAVAPTAKILIGGLALETSPDLWKKFGADGYAADARAALRAGDAFFAA